MTSMVNEFDSLLLDLFGDPPHEQSLDEQVRARLAELARPVDEPLSSANDESYGMGT